MRFSAGQIVAVLACICAVALALRLGYHFGQRSQCSHLTPDTQLTQPRLA